MENQYLFFRDTGLVDFHPLDCGMEKSHSLYSYGPCTRGHYVLHYVLSGCGTLNKNGNIVPVHAGEAFLIRPDESCLYRADAHTPWTYACIGFWGMQAK